MRPFNIEITKQLEKVLRDIQVPSGMVKQNHFNSFKELVKQYQIYLSINHLETLELKSPTKNFIATKGDRI
jgi:galactitol-specific phosphotransferase system IIB component